MSHCTHSEQITKSETCALRVPERQLLSEIQETYLNTFTAVVKKVVGTHYFLAIFCPIGAHFSSQPLRQPHRESQPYSRQEGARIWLNLKMMKVEVF